MGLFENEYGYFSDDGSEYIIKTPFTPRPWVNAISNGEYSFIVSQTGGGYSWRFSAGENRLTRSFQDIIEDRWGKYIYIRDNDTAQCWSLSYKPMCREPEHYEVHHGIGYTTFIQEYKGIESRWTLFAVPGQPLEIWRVKLINKSDRKRSLDLFTYMEWTLGNAPDEHREFHKLFIDTQYNNDINGFTVRKYMSDLANAKGQHSNRSWDYVAFHTSSLKPVSYDGDKESFIGMYCDEKNPKAVHDRVLARNVGRFGDAIASLQVSVNLEPYEQESLCFTLGCADNGEQAIVLAKRYNDTRECEAAFESMKNFWKPLLQNEIIRTPDKAMDFMTNTWLKYQAISCRIWGRAGYYQVSGGYGYRDQLQDSLIFLESAPEYTKERILIHAGKQHSDGTVLHWWMPLGNWGSITTCSDDLLWLPYVTENYIKETDDYSILDEVVPYYDGGEDTLYCHCVKAIERSFMRFSPRGIPLIGENDWNDGLNGIGLDMKGESFWVGEFLYAILTDFIPIMRLKADDILADKCVDVQSVLKENINKFGWDGQWYIQATTDWGDKIGSKDNKEGWIYLNPQTWAVISGIADEKRRKQCMDAVTEYLFKDCGTLLLYPAYSEPSEALGYISRYAPGLRENGGVYTHAATWAVVAYIMAGQPEKAYELYQKICPPNRSYDIDSYKVEPYVTPGNTDGPQSPNFGRGGWTWYSGSAQWLHRVAVQWILGIRPEKDGLLIAPAIPSAWDGFRYTRLFRGTIYDILINNNAHVNSGIKEIKLDDKKIDGNKLPDLRDGKCHKVEVIMG
ncbi:GH36-type glycosyl hydrolase domain-containing protein [Mahella australiensis]|uniref:Glycosyltransferase 36 n=1 Tax=Mahella australiensis (strain DSM 15567 / CIP 107919 / 50-1 BON) TaxID=697281 RepID=F4A1T7_MAHA5|nr:glycosyl transferase family 36 [Mahella australiensis]AEE97137.1 glycosyltransferase 36 [Mahella australiensis 50-1 BON]